MAIILIGGVQEGLRANMETALIHVQGGIKFHCKFGAG